MGDGREKKNIARIYIFNKTLNCSNAYVLFGKKNSYSNLYSFDATHIKFIAM